MRIDQRRKELDDIRQKSSRFHLNMAHLQTDADRLLNLLEKGPEVRTTVACSNHIFDYFSRMLIRSYRKLTRHCRPCNILDEI
jgi:hypothetical protein